MPYNIVTKAGAYQRPCELQAEVLVPLFDPPYLIPEFNNGTATGWQFASSLSAAHITNTFKTAGPGRTSTGATNLTVNPVLDGFTDITINAFTATRSIFGKQNPNANFAAYESPRVGNQVFPIYYTNTSNSIGMAQIIAPTNRDNNFETRPQRLFFSEQAIFGGSSSNFRIGFCSIEAQLKCGAFMNFDNFPNSRHPIKAFNPLAPQIVDFLSIVQCNPANNSVMYPSLPEINDGFLGLSNFTPFGATWGTSDNYPLILEWTALGGAQRLIRPVFDDPNITAAFSAGWVCQTCPNGFLYIGNFDYYTSQKFTYIFVSRDGKKYSRIKFVPQSGAAQAAILDNTFSGVRMFIDFLGVTYFKADNDVDKIFNSQGFSFPFQFNMTKLPYLSLPCWPPCYGVPLAQGNKL